MSGLALKGGTPLRTEKFPVWPQYGEKEFKALERVLKSGIWGTLGPEVVSFEKRFAQYHGSSHGIAVTNGTVTMEVILRALGIGYGDEVIIPPYTFYATASSVLMAGATPVFADIENDTFNLDADDVEKRITSSTKAVIPVHLGGRSCDMDKIMDIARKHSLYVIEDCAHAHGSEWKGKRVGSIGHAGSFSFQASKNLTSGEGGFIAVCDAEIYEKCWSVHNCGRIMKSGVWYDHYNISTNARMSEWQAAILDAQMDRLDEQIEKRQENAAYLNSRLKEIPCVEPLRHDERVTRNSHHIFVFRYRSENCKELSREMFIKALSAEGIPCSPGYSVPLYRQHVFISDEIRKVTGTKISYDDIRLKNTEEVSSKTGLWLGQNVMLSERKDMDEIADAIIKVFENSGELLADGS